MQLTEKTINKKVGVRVNLLLTTDEKKFLLEHTRRVGKLINQASRNFYEIFQDKEKYEDIKNRAATYRMISADKLMRDNMPLDELREQLGYEHKIFNRMAAAMAVKFYFGFDNRNGDYTSDNIKLANIPSTSNFKAIHLVDGMSRFKRDGEQFEFDGFVSKSGLRKCTNACIELLTHNGRRCYDFAIRQNQVEYFKLFNKNSMYTYGNLIPVLKYNRDNTINHAKTQFFIMVLVDAEIEPLYQPRIALGLDFNERKSVFCVPSLQDVPLIDVSKDFVHLDLIRDIKKTQEEINHSFGKMDSKSRRILRLKWKRLHKQSMKHLYENYVKPLIDIAIEKRALLCIDDLTFPDKSGFGYYQFKEMLVKEAYRKNIPMVLVPTWHTSSDCNHCYKIHGKYFQVGRSADKEYVSCEKCHKVYDADENAAKNIADDGTRIWNGLKRERPNKSFRKNNIKFIDYTLDSRVTF